MYLDDKHNTSSPVQSPSHGPRQPSNLNPFPRRHARGDLTPFAETLNEVLETSGLTLASLAKNAGVSRTHLESLKRGDSVPSGTLLRKLAKQLLKDDTGLMARDVVQLVVRAIASDEDELQRLVRVLPGVPQSFAEFRPERVSSCRGIVTDLLAEVHYPAVLRETITAMKRDGTEYLYFLKQSSSDWISLIGQVADNYSAQDLEHFKAKAMCVKCPDFLVYARMRIEHFFDLRPIVHISLGANTDPFLFRVEVEVVRGFIDLLKSVAEKAKRAVKAGETVVLHNELTFDLVDWERGL